MPWKLSYGRKNFGCWIVFNDPGSVTTVDQLALLLFFQGIPILGSMILTLGVYTLLAKKLNDISKELDLGTNIEIKKLFWYPAVLFIAMFPSVVDNVIELYYTTPNEVFTIIHIITTHSLGLTNAIVYGYQRKKYYDMYEKKWSEDEEDDIETERDALNTNKSNFMNESQSSRSEIEERPRKNSYYEHLLKARYDDTGY